MDSNHWDMQEAMNGGPNPFDIDGTWEPNLLPDLTQNTQDIAGTNLIIHEDKGALPVHQRASIPNTAPLRTLSGSASVSKAETATNSKRKSLASGMVSTEKEVKDTKKGTTNLVNGSLHWYDPDTKIWLPAVIHDDIRGALIKEAQDAHPGRRYLHPDPGSGRLYDETAFKIEHEQWGPDRKDRPEICFQWEEIEERPHRTHPGFMKHDGKIVLGPTDKPIVAWPEIPATLSSGTPGYKLEAMRRQNMDIKQGDFWARMPRVFYEKHNDHRIPVALRDVNTMVNMPLLRFRATAGCLSWTTRDGTSGLETGLLKMFAKRDFDPVANGNSTRRFRDLLPFEQEQVKAENADGRYEKQAGDRRISPEKRAELQKRREARWAREEEKLQRQMVEDRKGLRKRNLEEDTEDDAEVARPSKRARTAPERGEGKTIGPTVNDLQHLEADKEMSERRASGPFPPFKKSKGLLQKAVNKNASQHRAKAVATPIFDMDSSDDDIPLIVRRKQQPKPAAPILSSDSEDSDTPLIITARRRQAPAAPILNPDSETNAAPSKVTKRKRPAADADSDDDTDFVPRGGRRHRQAAPVIESDSASDSDPDPVVINPRKRRRPTSRTMEHNEPASLVLPEATGEPYAHGTANYEGVMGQLQRVNKRMRDELGNHSDDDKTPLAPPTKRRRNIQQSTTNTTNGTNNPQRKAKKTRHLSRPHTESHSQEHLGDILAGKVAKVIASFTPTDLNPLQTAPTTERYYDQVAEALQPTINAYLDLTGYEAPPTNRWDSYATQWQRIYNSFKFDWGMITDEKLPNLIRLTPTSQLHRRSREWCRARLD